MINQDAVSHLSDPTSKEFVALLEMVADDIVHTLEGMTYEQRLAELTDQPLNIALIENPTEEMQMKAIESNPDCYYFIEKPTDAVSEKAKELIFKKRIES